MIRPEVQALYDMGRFPSDDEEDNSEEVTEEQVWEDPFVKLVQQYETHLQSVRPPLSDEEAILLCPLFGEDTFYGLAFILRNLVEAAPSWPIWSAIDSASPDWQKILSRRAENSGYSR